MTEKPEASVLTARRATQHFRLSSRDDACEHLNILIMRSSLGPSPPNAGRYTVASRFRRRSCERGYIAANAQVHWVAQISANLLRDEELVDLIPAAGGKWIFIGMESIDPANLADVKKGFNKPGEYGVVLDRLAQRNVFAITSFIFDMDNDTPGVAERTLKELRTWPPGLPIFGLMTPLPATPLYKRLEAAGRLTRPKHWQEFIPFP